jgi:ABC-type Fe3+-hydroxamate transport system substrate-binding protein
MVIRDALGRTIRFKKPPESVVSLVPSITETLFSYGLDREILGVTDYCIHPEERLEGKERVGGPKSLNVDKVIEIGPDLVVANMEENDKSQVEDLISKGMSVFVCFPRSVEDALTLMLELGWLLGKRIRASDIVEEIKEMIVSMKAPQKRRKVLCPIWKNPYMSFNGRTFCSSLLGLCGGDNIFADRQASYFEFTLDEARALRPDIVLLPSEPYAFTGLDAEFFQQALLLEAANGRVHIVEGELITWFGVRIKEALKKVPAFFA